MYYNTTNVIGKALIDFSDKSQSQKETVYSFFKRKRKEYSWSELAEIFPHINEISIKRSLSDLKNEGFLCKTDKKVKGKYGRPCYKYKLIQ